MSARRIVLPASLFLILIFVSRDMRISIITPSFQQPEWLRLCAASVADQNTPGLEIEHIVQDSMSGPEVAAAVSAFPQLRLVREKDQGMYDAINRGWEKAMGDVLCWLNCDEQYLPGTLKKVAEYFQEHPEVDVLCGDTVVMDGEGNYQCSRQVLPPRLAHTWVCTLPILSCSVFFRSKLIKEQGFKFNTQLKAIGDADLILRMLSARVRMGVLRDYLAAFGDDGENLNLKPHAQQERKIQMHQAPLWIRLLRPVWMLQHRLRRLWHGLYRPVPFTYDIYTKTSPQQRVHFEVSQPTFYWKDRMRLHITPIIPGRN